MAARIQDEKADATIEIPLRLLRLALMATVNPYRSAEDGANAAHSIGENIVRLHYSEGDFGKTVFLKIPETFTLPLAPQPDAE